MKLVRLFFVICWCGGIGWSCQDTGQSNASSEEILPVDPYADADPFTIDTLQSVVTWIGSEPTGRHNGIIPISNGELLLLDGRLVGGKVTLNIKALQVMDLDPNEETHALLKNHLLSDDFFDATHFPTATFEITQITPFDSTSLKAMMQTDSSEYAPATSYEFMVSEPTHSLSGNLELRGITRNLTFPVAIRIHGESLQAEAKFSLDRTEWGLSYQTESNLLDKLKDQFIFNTVNVGFSLRTVGFR